MPHTPVPQTPEEFEAAIREIREPRRMCDGCGNVKTFDPPVNTFETGECPRCKGTKFRIFSR